MMRKSTGNTNSITRKNSITNAIQLSNSFKRSRQGSHQWDIVEPLNIVNKVQKRDRSALSTDKMRRFKYKEDDESEDNEAAALIISNQVPFNLQNKQTSFSKTHSEPDFYIREQKQRNQFLMGEQNDSNKIQLIDTGIKLFKEYQQMNFKFDNIIVPENTQPQVFYRIQNIVKGFLLGACGTIFAYGQTGAGKTFTIMGIENVNQIQNQTQTDNRGILPNTLEYVLNQLNKENQNESQQKCKLSLSFYEIYNEKIYDLLAVNKKQAKKESLEIREEKDGNFSVVDLKKVRVNTLQEAYECMDLGLQRRVISATTLNSKSSRSHSVFQFYLEKISPDGTIIRSKLRIVDLAGSEKYMIKKDLPAAEKNLKVQELTSINGSLSALGQCISALAEPTRKHIPYRNSKLTKVLKDSLDDKSNVALIICISPSIDSYKETLSTLQFADRAKKAVLDGRNFSDSRLLGNQQNKSEGGSSMDALLTAYKEEKAIRKELEQYMKDSFKNEVMEELQRLKQQNKELQEKVTRLEGKKHNKKQSNDNNDTSRQEKKEKFNVYKSGRGCLKVNTNKGPTSNAFTPNILNDSLDEKNSPRRVRFATKLDNDTSLDSETRERIEHNLKYNDDTIFDNISIFRDVSNSGMASNKIVDKEVHPSLLKNKIQIDDEDDDSSSKGNSSPHPIEIVNFNKKTESEKRSPQTQQNQLQVKQDLKVVAQPFGKGSEDFWDLPAKERMGVSPIQRKKINTSSQEVSKDLIELGNDEISPMLKIQFGDKTIGSNKRSILPVKVHNKQLKDEQELVNDPQLHQIQGDMNNEISADIEDDSGDCAKDYHVCDTSEQFYEGDFSVNQEGNQEQILLGSILEPVTVDDAGDRSNDNQNTLIFDSQSIIIENGDLNPSQNLPKDPNVSLQMQMQQLEASSIMQQPKEYQLEEKATHSAKKKYKHTNQLSINSALQQRQLQSQVKGQNAMANQLILQSSGNINSSQNHTDALTYSLSNTYSTIESLHDELALIRKSLTWNKHGNNVMKEIQKYARDIEENKIQYEALNDINEEDPNFESDVHHNVNKFSQEDIQEKQYGGSLEDENVKSLDEEEDVVLPTSGSQGSQKMLQNISDCDTEEQDYIVKDMQQYYNKIHQEIYQLKSIMLDQSLPATLNLINNNSSDNNSIKEGDKSNRSDNSASPKKHNLSGKVENKQSSIKQPSRLIKESSENEIIDHTQSIINELKTEMTEIFQSKKLAQIQSATLNKQQYHEAQQIKQHTASNISTNNQKSLKIIALLEQLQQNLIQKVIPTIQKQPLAVINSQDSTPSSIAALNAGPPVKAQNKVTSLRRNTYDSSNIIRPSTFYKEPITKNSDKNVPLIVESRSTKDQNNLISSEDFSPSFNSNVIGLDMKQLSSIHANQDYPTLTRQKTPELFKSLAQYSSEDQETSMNKNNPNNISNIRNSMDQLQDLANNLQNVGNSLENRSPDKKMMFFNLQSQAPDLNQQRKTISIDEQEFQTTLRQSITSNHNNGNMPLQYRTGSNTAEKKNPNTTLTLVFDSDEENQEEEENENEGRHSQPNKKPNENSFFDEGTSNILADRGNSVTHKLNYQVSSQSFQGDQSLIFLANNLVVPKSRFNNNNNSSISNNNDLFETAGKQKRNQSYIMDQRGDEGDVVGSQQSNSFKGYNKVPSSNNLLSANRRSLVHSTKLGSSQNNIVQPLESIISYKDQSSSMSSIMENTTPNYPTQEENNHTSKQSVLKYWNQFFNKDSNVNVAAANGQNNNENNSNNQININLTNQDSNNTEKHNYEF